MMGLPSEITLFNKIADAVAVLKTEEKILGGRESRCW
jgi:hypothetical protein